MKKASKTRHRPFVQSSSVNKQVYAGRCRTHRVHSITTHLPDPFSVCTSLPPNTTHRTTHRRLPSCLECSRLQFKSELPDSAHALDPNFPGSSPCHRCVDFTYCRDHSPLRTRPLCRFVLVTHRLDDLCFPAQSAAAEFSLFLSQCRLSLFSPASHPPSWLTMLTGKDVPQHPQDKPQPLPPTPNLDHQPWTTPPSSAT